MDRTDIAQRRPARERIVSTAYALFTRRGVRAVGIDEIISQSGVAKATMYRHFPTKNDLVLAVLQRREQLWTFDLVERQSRLRGSTPEEQLLAIFDVFHDWFQKREDFDGCSFINVLIELGATHPAGHGPHPHRTTPTTSRQLNRNRDVLHGRRVPGRLSCRRPGCSACAGSVDGVVESGHPVDHGADEAVVKMRAVSRTIRLGAPYLRP